MLDRRSAPEKQLEAEAWAYEAKEAFAKKLGAITRTRTAYIAAINVLLLPAAYAFVAWIISKVDTNITFWVALAGAVGTMVLLDILSSLHRALLWRVGSRTVAINDWLVFLHCNDFPTQRYDHHDDIGNYLCRIQDDATLNPRLRMAAKEMATRLEAFEKAGIVTGMRMRSAADAALERYAPRANAPEFTS